MSTDWRLYIDAAHRKIEIATFHYEQLKIALENCPPNKHRRPDVPTQAHFEGVIIAVVAAIDQVAQCANSALGLGSETDELFKKTAPKIEERVPEYKKWRENPLGIDLRKIRTRMVHYSYQKTPAGEMWVVEPANNSYEESRELLKYAQSALAYGKDLSAIAESLKSSLESSQI